MSRRIYLASPYSHEDMYVRSSRYSRALDAATLLTKQGLLVFSPIVHSHAIARDSDLPKDFDFWREWCLSFIRSWATELCILPLDGWEKSVGVQAEIAEAKRLGLPVWEYGKN